MFRRDVIPPSSGPKSKPSNQQEESSRGTSLQLHGVAPQKMMLLIYTGGRTSNPTIFLDKPIMAQLLDKFPAF
jgi:hypothetical protein